MNPTSEFDGQLTRENLTATKLFQDDGVALLGANLPYNTFASQNYIPTIYTSSDISSCEDDKEEEEELSETYEESPMDVLQIRSSSPPVMSSLTNTQESCREDFANTLTVIRRNSLPLQNSVNKNRFIPFADVGYVLDRSLMNSNRSPSPSPPPSCELQVMKEAAEIQEEGKYDIESATFNIEENDILDESETKIMDYGGQVLDEMSTLPDERDALKKDQSGVEMTPESHLPLHSPSYSTIFCNRLLLCTIEILVLWCTSLRIVSTVVREYIPSPTIAHVGQECSASYATIEQQQERYSTCSRTQTQACFAHLQKKVTDEHARVNEVEAINDQLISQMQNATLGILYDYDLLVNSLQHWVEANPTTGLTYSSTCSTQNRSTLQSLLGDYSSSANKIFSSSIAYTHTSDQRVSNMAAHDAEKNAYNILYMGNKFDKIEISLDKMLISSSQLHSQYQNVSGQDAENVVRIADSCLNASTTDSLGCPYTPTMVEVYRDIQEDMDIQKSTLESYFGAYEKVASDYEDAVQNAIQNADAFFDAAESIKEYLNALDIVGLNLCQFSFCDFSKLSWAVPQLRLPDPIPIRSVPSREEFSNTLGPVLQGVKAEFNGSLIYGQVANENIQKYYQESVESLNLTIADYRPPAYQYAANVQEEAQLQAATSAAYLAELNSNMSGFSGNSQNDLSTSMEDTVVNATSTFSRSSMSAYDLFIGPWLSGKIDSNVFISTVDAIEYFLVIFDMIYRVFQSLKVIRKHWKGVITSPLDIRSRRSLFSSIIFGNKTNVNPNACQNNRNVRTFCFLLYHLWFYMVVAMVFMTVVLTSLIHLYVPIFNAYITHCVQEGQTIASSSVSSSSYSSDSNNTPEVILSNITESGESNDDITYVGTFLARNLNSLAINYASMNGNAEITRSVSEYNVASSDACSEHYTTSSNTYQQQKQLFEQTRVDYFDRLYSRNFIYNCMNNTAVSELFVSACSRDDALSDVEILSLNCPRPYEFYPSFNFERDADDYALATSALQQNTFDCSVLPACVLSCSGPEVQMIQTESTKCACVGEWMIHANILQGLMIIFVYTLLNISRVVTFKGIGNLLWKHLSLRQYEFVGSCSYEGDIIDDGGYFTEVDSSTDRKALHKKIMRMESKFHWKGVSMIAIGILLNIPYMWALHTIRANIEYAP